MSSHHIVRDEQEPALILISSKIDQDVLGNLLEWSPTVIVDAKILDELALQGIKLDIVIGSEEEVHEAKIELKNQEPVKYLIVNNGADRLLQALYFLSGSKYKAVNISTDMSIGLSDSLEKYLNQLDIVIYDGSIKWIYCINFSFKKWLPCNREIHFLNHNVEVSTREKKQKREMHRIKIEADGLYEFKSAEPGFWLGEAI